MNTRSEDQSPEFQHVRHQPTRMLPAGCELVVACPQLRSNVNLSRIARAAGCCGVKRMVIEGNSRIDAKIARDSAETIEFTRRRSIGSAIKQLKTEGFRMVGLEQATRSKDIYHFQFPPRTALVIGNERTGMTEELLAMMQDVIEIPVFGLPYSYNVSTATSMCLYEYCRQMVANGPSADG